MGFGSEHGSFLGGRGDQAVSRWTMGWRNSDRGDVIAADPLADLMFTMIAIILLMFITLLPNLTFAARTTPAGAEALSRAHLELDHRSAISIAAIAGGLRLPDRADLIPVDANHRRRSFARASGQSSAQRRSSGGFGRSKRIGGLLPARRRSCRLWTKDDLPGAARFGLPICAQRKRAPSLRRFTCFAIASMSDRPPEVTTLSDISANMFAAFILILLMAVAAAAERRPPPQNPADRVVTQKDLRFVLRQALDPAAMLSLLYDRRPTAPGLSVDLFANRLVVTPASGKSTVLKRSEATTEALRSRIDAQPGPARLYVFSNAFYGPVADAFDGGRLSYKELSVPVALRRADLDGWSDDFEALAAHSDNFLRFRDGLARILGGGEGAAPAALSASRGSDGESASKSNLWARLLHVVHVLLIGLAVFAAGLSVLWIEVRTRRAEPCISNHRR